MRDWRNGHIELQERDQLFPKIVFVYVGFGDTKRKGIDVGIVNSFRRWLVLSMVLHVHGTVSQIYSYVVATEMCIPAVTSLNPHPDCLDLNPDKLCS